MPLVGGRILHDIGLPAAAGSPIVAAEAGITVRCPAGPAVIIARQYA